MPQDGRGRLGRLATGAPARERGRTACQCRRQSPADPIRDMVESASEILSRVLASGGRWASGAPAAAEADTGQGGMR